MSTKAQLQSQIEAQSVLLQELETQQAQHRAVISRLREQVKDLTLRLEVATSSNRKIAEDWIACHGEPGSVGQLERLLDYVSERRRL